MSVQRSHAAVENDERSAGGIGCEVVNEHQDGHTNEDRIVEPADGQLQQNSAAGLQRSASSASSGIAEGSGDGRGLVAGEGSSASRPAPVSLGPAQQRTCEGSQASSKKRQLAEPAEDEDEWITIPNHSATIEDGEYTMVDLDGLPTRLRLVSGIRRCDGQLVGECYKCDRLPMELSKLALDPSDQRHIELQQYRFEKLVDEYDRDFQTEAEVETLEELRKVERELVVGLRGPLCVYCNQ